MEWITRLNCALRYIEEHLSDEIDYEQLADIACCSTYHFQRMFAYMAKIPLSEYIRRRRMSKAAVDLQSGDEKVIDIALKYGYESPTAFNRAFRSVHGIAPSQAKHDGITLKAYLPINFKLIIKGDVEMNFRIEKKEAFRIIGVSTPLQQGDNEKNFKIVPKFWRKSHMKGTVKKLVGLMKNDPMGMLGVSVYGKNSLKYYIAVSNGDETAHKFEEYTVPALTWAIFPGEGARISMQDLQRSIFTEWLPSSGFEYAEVADIEVFLNADPKNSKFEVWIPVVKRDSK